MGDDDIFGEEGLLTEKPRVFKALCTTMGTEIFRVNKLNYIIHILGDKKAK